MKKIIMIFGIVFLLFVAVLVAIPLFFKDDITQLVKNSTNTSLNATIDFDDVDLSLIKSFPNLAISLDKFTIINNEPFEGDTVISARQISAAIDLISLIKGDEIHVNSIYLDSPKIMMYKLKDGSANYNIAKKDADREEHISEIDTSNASFNIKLKNYTIENGRIAFIDQLSDMILVVNNLNHSGSGDFSQNDFILDTKTEIDELTFQTGGVKYLNKVKTNLNMQLAVNLAKMTFALKDNELNLNNLQMKFNGSISMPNDDIGINLTFSSSRSAFKDIISLIPAIYKNDFSDLKSEGSMELAGNINGVLSENKIPSFNLDLLVKEGNFQYPNLPTPVNNVNLNLNVSNKDGKIDNTVIDLKNIHLELGTDPIDGKLKLKNPETGPIIDLNLIGKINLANLNNALELKNIKKLEGIVNSNFSASGNLSNIGNNYDKVNAKGNISVSNIIYEDTESAQNISVKNANLNFTPRDIKLSGLTAQIGESDISANGSLNNLISYILSDGVLSGNINISSDYFDFNPYLSEEEVEDTDKIEDGEITAFSVPNNINFKMQSRFKKLLYDNLELTNVEGTISVKDSRVTLSKMRMNLMGGSLSGSGYYSKSELIENPDINFDLNITDFNIKQTYDKFISVKQFAPIAKYIQGNFSSNLKMKSSLDKSLTPVWETFFSNGLLNLKTAEIKDFKPFATVGSMLNLNELSNPKLQNIKPKFEIKNGRFYLSPVKYKIANYEVVLSGSNGLDQSLNYTMEIDVPAEKVRNQANKTISGLLGSNVDLVKSKTVKVKALIGGTIDNPKVKTSAADVASDVVEEVKDAIVAEATTKIDSAKAAAEKKLKDEAKKKEEELKKKLEEEAKKKLKKLFKFG